MWPDACDAALQVAVEPRLEQLDGGRLAVVAQLRGRQAERIGVLGERRSEQREHLAASGDELRAELCDLLRPGRDRVARGRAREQPPERRVALRDRGAVIRGELGARRSEAPEPPVEVRAPRCGSALHDAETVRCEHERRQLRAQLLGASERRAVERGVLGGAWLELHLDADGRVRPAALDGDACAVLSEPDQLLVVARARREPLRRDVQRLEQVRLACAVRPRREDEPRPERELEPLVRPEAAERDRLDDQPGRRIGMTRYVKSSPSPWITAGRRGLMSFTRTSSLSSSSRPSRRKSALNPISSTSPVYATGSDSCDSPTSCVRAITVSSPSANRSCSGVARWIITDARRMTSSSSTRGSVSSCSNDSGSSCR